MPPETFRGDPYAVLDLPSNTGDAAIKRRWRELAHAHHPDRAGGDEAATATLTRRMAHINAAYELLRDHDRRARYDVTHPGHGHGTVWAAGDADGRQQPVGPPPPRPTRPVTARFDTSEHLRPRNATTSRGPSPLNGLRPRSARERAEAPEPLRASDPNGPVRRRRNGARSRRPTLEQARATLLEFGKFRGHTLGQVADFEPTYIDWIAGTITRDREVVMGARTLQADLDERGVVRRYRPSQPPFGRTVEDRS
ncbi:MAG: DnaJ domain-containing protein [Candidatus Limnocylindrales bacterium]